MSNTNDFWSEHTQLVLSPVFVGLRVNQLFPYTCVRGGDGVAKGLVQTEKFGR